MTLEEAIRRIASGEVKVTPFERESYAALGAREIERHMTRCARCTRLAKVDAENGWCAGCLNAVPQRVVCAWDGAVIREGRAPVSHGLCDGCSRLYFIEDQAGPQREVALDAQAERVALCKRNGVSR